MRHYHVIKRTAHSLILASALLIVANVSIWTASMFFFSSASVEAACSADDQPATVHIQSTQGQAAQITVAKKTPGSAFNYRVQIFDRNNGWCPDTFCLQNTNAKNLYDQTFSVASPVANPEPITTNRFTNLAYTGDRATVDVVLTFTTYEDQNAACTHTPIHQQIIYSKTDVITGGNATIGVDTPDPNFTVDANNNIIDVPTINITVNNDESLQNMDYQLLITDCNGTPQLKSGGYLSGSSTISWTPSQTCANHDIILTVGGTEKARYSLSIGTTTSTASTSDDENDITPSVINLENMVGFFTFPKHLNTFTQIFEFVVEFLVWILGVLAFISLVVGGVQFITSGGDSAKAAKAKKTLLYSAIGIVLAIFSVTIYNIAAAFWGGPK